uniref:Uncharacterized protein n=1 Tax=Anguilla anguilla TaxID=7936 RepID=A0A0E9UYH6_ANGAN
MFTPQKDEQHPLAIPGAEALACLYSEHQVFHLKSFSV